MTRCLRAHVSSQCRIKQEERVVLVAGHAKLLCHFESDRGTERKSTQPVRAFVLNSADSIQIESGEVLQ